MNQSAIITYQNSSYEIRFNGTKVYRITRYIGDEQHPENLTWTDVPLTVKALIIKEVKDALKNATH